VTFNDLPIEEGLKRILTNLNYSLMFDKKNKVAGVMVMGESKPALAQTDQAWSKDSEGSDSAATTPRPSPTAKE